MKTRAWFRVRRVLLVSVATAAMLALASPASASVEGAFSVYTSDACAVADFVDYGPGAPGGGNNDDYALVGDICEDSHGVRAWAWLNGIYLGSVYDGNGSYASDTIWDPFKPVGNVGPGDEVTLEVCLVDGSGDTTGSRCGIASRVSVDG